MPYDRRPIHTSGTQASAAAARPGTMARPTIPTAATAMVRNPPRAITSS